MANFSCKLEVAKSVKTNKKTKGTKSRSHYDYIRREEKYKDKEDLVENGKFDVNFEKIDCDNPREFWEKSEDKNIVGKRYVPYKEFTLTLPYELSNEENIALIREFCEERFEDKFVYSVGIHAPDFSNKNMKEKHPGDRQVHAHIMICLKEIDLENPMNFEQFLKPYNYREKEKPKEERFGGAQPNLYMNSTKARKDEVTGEYGSTFLKDSRKMWESKLNEALTKYNENPEVINKVELVSCKSLKAQKEDAILDGDFKKAFSLDRPPINLPMRLIKVDKSNPNWRDNLPQKDVEAIENFELAIFMKIEKENIISNLNNTNEDYKNRSNSTFPLELEIDNCVKNISKIQNKIDGKELEREVLSKVSGGEYFKIQNQLTWKSNKNSKERKDKLLKKLRALESKYKDNELYKSTYKGMKFNYEKKIEKLKQSAKISASELKKYSLDKDFKDLLDRIEKNKLASDTKDNSEMKKEILAAYKEIEDTIYTNMCNEKTLEVENSILSLKDDLKVQNHYLKQDPGFLERRKINNEIEKITSKIRVKTDELSKIKTTLPSIKGTKDFEDELTKNKSTAKTDIEDKYKKNVEQLEKSTANKPKNITQYVANKVNNKKIIAKENSPFSVDIQLSGIEELDKDKENER